MTALRTLRRDRPGTDWPRPWTAGSRDGSDHVPRDPD